MQLPLETSSQERSQTLRRPELPPEAPTAERENGGTCRRAPRSFDRFVQSAGRRAELLRRDARTVRDRRVRNARMRSRSPARRRYLGVRAVVNAEGVQSVPRLPKHRAP